MSELDEIKDAIDRAGVWPGSQPRDYVASVRNMADELTSLLDKLELARLERDEAQDTITGLRNEIRAVRTTLDHRERVGGMKGELDLERQQCAEARNELYRLQRSIDTTLSLCGGEAPTSVRDLVERYNEQRRLIRQTQVSLEAFLPSGGRSLDQWVVALGNERNEVARAADEVQVKLQEAVSAERDRCAQVCERIAAEHSTAARIESELDGCRRTSAYAASRLCAREIRKQAKPA
jgi:uncharacterized protein YPO0396